MKDLVTNQLRLLAAICAALMLGGCSSVSLLQLDNEWTRTHQAQLQAESAPEKTPEYLATDFGAQLAAISERAVAEGDKLAATDAATAVAFYRIAALSAWKSGKQAEDKVTGVSAKGTRTCQSLKGGPAAQPRDCTLLTMVPYLAAYDRATRGMREILARADSSAGKSIAAGELDTSERIIADASAATLKIASIRNSMEPGKSPLPESFFAYTDVTVKLMYCTTLAFIGRAQKTDMARFEDDGQQLFRGVKKSDGSDLFCP